MTFYLRKRQYTIVMKAPNMADKSLCRCLRSLNYVQTQVEVQTPFKKMTARPTAQFVDN